MLPGLSVAVDLNEFKDCVLVFMDIETTSGSVYDLEVVQVAASAVSWPSLTPLPKSSFNMFARNVRPVSAFVRRKLTSMDWGNLATMPRFKDVLEEFFQYLSHVGSLNVPIVMVAHNGKAFDIPALFNASKDVDVDVDIFSH